MADEFPRLRFVRGNKRHTVMNGLVDLFMSGTPYYKYVEAELKKKRVAKRAALVAAQAADKAENDRHAAESKTAGREDEVDVEEEPVEEVEDDDPQGDGKEAEHDATDNEDQAPKAASSPAPSKVHSIKTASHKSTVRSRHASTRGTAHESHSPPSPPAKVDSTKSKRSVNSQKTGGTSSATKPALPTGLDEAKDCPESAVIGGPAVRKGSPMYRERSRLSYPSSGRTGSAGAPLSNAAGLAKNAAGQLDVNSSPHGQVRISNSHASGAGLSRSSIARPATSPQNTGLTLQAQNQPNSWQVDGQNSSHSSSGRPSNNFNNATNAPAHQESTRNPQQHGQNLPPPGPLPANNFRPSSSRPSPPNTVPKIQTTRTHSVRPESASAQHSQGVPAADSNVRTLMAQNWEQARQSRGHSSSDASTAVGTQPAARPNMDTLNWIGS